MTRGGAKSIRQEVRGGHRWGWGVDRVRWKKTLDAPLRRREDSESNEEIFLGFYQGREQAIPWKMCFRGNTPIPNRKTISDVMETVHTRGTDIGKWLERCRGREGFEKHLRNTFCRTWWLTIVGKAGNGFLVWMKGSILNWDRKSNRRKEKSQGQSKFRSAQPNENILLTVHLSLLFIQHSEMIWLCLNHLPN